MKPKRLTSYRDRRFARRERDGQWEFMERVAREGVVWMCPWDKYRKHGPRCVNSWCQSGTFDKLDNGYQCRYCKAVMAEIPDDHVYVFGLLGSNELYDWLNRHKNWWKHGRWSSKRCARSIRITDAGRRALTERHLYDMEPILGGMVEPGYIVTPLPPKNVTTPTTTTTEGTETHGN